MAADYRHAGIGWPENAGGEHPNRDAIIALPGMQGACLICAPSARYHYDLIRQRCPSATVVWRAIPRQGKLPAQLGWNADKVAAECLNLWNEQPHGGVEWFQPLNELQFDKEAGESFRGYSYIAAQLGAVRVALQDRFRLLGTDVRLMFPAWVPTDDGDRLHEWRDEAARWGAICVHCYGSAETMRSRYQSYRDAFPGKPLFVGEWNSNHEGHDERSSLQMWADVASADPLFLGATYFIWETNNAGEQDLSIWGNEDRLRLFRDPPVVAQPEPAPTPEPVPIPAPEPTTMISGIDVSNNNGTIDWDAVVSAGVTWAYAKVSEGSGYRDRFFPANWAAMRERGLARGGYHFARPSENDPETEADWFLSLVDAAGGLDVGDFLVLDHEDEQASGDTGWWALQWLRYVEQQVGFKPMIYTGKWIIDGQGLASYPELAEYGLILAAYQGAVPPAPAPWPFLAGWQNDDQTGVPGVTGDHDWFFGTVEQLRLYGKPGIVEPPATPPTPETMTVDAVAFNRLVSYAGYTSHDLSARVKALAGKNKADRAERDAIVAEMVRAGAEALA